MFTRARFKNRAKTNIHLESNVRCVSAYISHYRTDAASSTIV
jgi:hypothetical protein